MTPAGAQARAPEGLTVEGALEHVVEAAQQLVADQIKLARLEIDVAASRIIRGGELVAVGAVMLAGAWVALMMAAYVLSADVLSPAQRLGVIALVNGASGIGLILAGSRRMKAHGSG